jgi:hypothetical protein
MVNRAVLAHQLFTGISWRHLARLVDPKLARHLNPEPSTLTGSKRSLRGRFLPLEGIFFYFS